MTSFVREILSASGKLGEKEDMAMTLNRLKKQTEETKAELRYEDFSDKDQIGLNTFLSLQSCLD